MFINGEWRNSEESFESINPYNREAWALIPQASKEDVDEAIDAASGFPEDVAKYPRSAKSEADE